MSAHAHQPSDSFSDPFAKLFTHPNWWRWTLLLLFAITLVRYTWIGDDAAITLRSVLNFVHGYGPTFNIDERVQSFTHPLWFLLVSAGSLLLGNAFVAVVLLSWLCTLAALWLLLRMEKPFSAWSLTAALALLLSQAFIDYAASGLETPLAFLVLALFARTLQLPEEHPRRATWLVLIASLGYLTRPDLILLMVPTLLYVLYRTGRPGAILRTVLIDGLPVLLWSLFSLAYYGLLFPNTAYAKLNHGIPQGELLLQGLRYFLDSLQHDPATLATILFAGLVALRRGSALDRLLALGMALYLIYVLKIGGDFMSGRFFAVPLFAAAVLLVRQAGQGSTRPLPWFLAVLALGLTSQHPLGDPAEVVSAGDWKDGIVDERAYYFAERGLLPGNRQRFFEQPAWPDAEQTTGQIFDIDIIDCGGMGYSALESGPLIHVTDHCALANPLLAFLPSINHPEWRIGHFMRHLPAGYRESIVTDSNRIQEPQMAAAYEQIRLLTRGPLFSRERWAAILEVNLFGLEIDPPAGGRNRSEIHLEMGQLDQTKPPGTPWNAPGNVIFSAGQSLVIELGQTGHFPELELSLDHNDTYRLEFLQGDLYCGMSRIEPAPRGEGLHTYRIDVPTLIAERGYDRLRLIAEKGDGAYALGHLLPF